MNYSEYAAIDAVNWSTLKEMRVSPKHFLHRKQNGRPDTAAMSLGRAAHAALLEPHLMAEYMVWDTALGNRNTNAYRAWKAELGDREEITQDDLAKAVAMREAVLMHPRAGRYFTGEGENEVVLEWTDTVTGLACKCKLDRITVIDGIRYVVDFKTTGVGITMRKFASQAATLSYHGQLGFYSTGVRAIYGDDLPIVCIIVVCESDEPHDCGPMYVGSGIVDMGAALASDLLDRLADCTKANEWPGQYPAEVPLDYPEWAMAEDNEIDGLGIEFAPKGVTVNG